MRTMIVLMFLALLAGCNGSSDDDTAFATTAQLPPNEATAVAAMRAQIATLQGQVSRFNELTLIGKPSSVVSSQGISPDDFRTMGELVQTAAVAFGPCTNMGVLIGFENSFGAPANGLTAAVQDFRQCTGYQYGARISDGSITTSERIFWDGPNCTGNLLEWEAGGAGYNTTTLKNGVVFTNPADGVTVEMVKAGQIAQPIQIQSVWVRENPGCQSDVETQLMYQVTPNDVTVSAIPSGGVGAFQLGAP